MAGLPAAEVFFRSLLGVVCVFLPGLAALVWWPMPRRGFAERAAVSFGMGVSLIALAALLGNLLSFAYTAWIIGALEVLCAVAVILGMLRARPASIRVGGLGLLALLVFAGILLLRFYQIRDLALPPWVDSVHHALLVRIFVERGGLPSDLSPWLPIPFHYHFGFHAAAALFAAVSNLAADTVLLVFGQLLNAMAALSVYRLSMALRRDRSRAVVAMALTGFVAQMPAFYLAWGRYTLLMGMILLPLAMAEAVEFTRRAPRWGGLARLAVLTAGVLLAHYLAGLLLAAFLLLLGFAELVWSRHRRRILGVALAAIAGGAMSLPWLIPMLQHSAPEIGVNLLTPSDSVDAAYFANYTGYLWLLLGPLRNYLLTGAGLIALAAAILRKNPMRILAVWAVFVAVEALPWGLHLAPFRPDHMIIVLFLPAVILAADSLVGWTARLQAWKPGWHPRFWMTAGVVALCAAGIWDTRSIVRPATIFADASDREAILWAADHSPPDALFLINTAAWQSGLYRGVDGGWWLLPLADRQTLLPPMLYSFGPPEYIAETNARAEAVSRLTGCSADFWSLVNAYRVTYVYVREDAGSLRLSSLLLCDGLERVFLNQKVGIFRILPER